VFSQGPNKEGLIFVFFLFGLFWSLNDMLQSGCSFFFFYRIFYQKSDWLLLSYVGCVIQ
jgi:hypothetical protein